jgi:sec-independent protein translocase protein TatB
MFDIGWSELLLIGIVALIVIGPKELPGALRTLGQWTSKLRRMASEFQGQFHEAMREAEMADLKKQVDDLTSDARSYTSFDPIGDVRKEVESTQRQIESALSDAPVPSSPAASPLPLPEDSSSHGPAPPTSIDAASGGAPVVAPGADGGAALPAPTPQPAPADSDLAHQQGGGKPA